MRAGLGTCHCQTNSVAKHIASTSMIMMKVHQTHGPQPALCILYYLLYAPYYILYTMYYILYTIFYILYNIYIYTVLYYIILYYTKLPGHSAFVHKGLRARQARTQPSTPSAAFLSLAEALSMRRCCASAAFLGLAPWAATSLSALQHHSAPCTQQVSASATGRRSAQGLLLPRKTPPLLTPRLNCK